MPTKTKKEKIIAEYRRKLSSLQPDQPVTYTIDSTPKPAPAVLSEVLVDNRAIKKDILTTLFLAMLIIMFELIISWKFA